MQLEDVIELCNQYVCDDIQNLTYCYWKLHENWIEVCKSADMKYKSSFNIVFDVDCPRLYIAGTDCVLAIVEKDDEEFMVILDAGKQMIGENNLTATLSTVSKEDIK